MRIIIAVAALLLSANAASAQLRIRAPFVRVEVNGGVHVRAPFVNLFVPGSPPPVYVAPPPAFVPPAPMRDESEPLPPVPPAPKLPREGNDASPPALAPAGLTVEAFVKSFKPKAGSYEVELINPVNNQPTTVRFTLPEGTPRRVHLGRREIEFDYGARQYVKIQFDSDGAVVIAR